MRPAPWFLAVLLSGASARVAPQAFMPLRPGTPLGPTTYEACDAYRQQWQQAIDDLNQRHERCLTASRPPDVQVPPGQEDRVCSQTACQSLHTMLHQFQNEQGPAVDDCRRAVDQYKEQERLREARDREEREQARRDSAEAAERARGNRHDSDHPKAKKDDKKVDLEQLLTQWAAEDSRRRWDEFRERSAAREKEREKLEEQAQKASGDFNDLIAKQGRAAQQSALDQLDKLRQAPSALPGTSGGDFDLGGQALAGGWNQVEDGGNPANPFDAMSVATAENDGGGVRTFLGVPIGRVDGDGQWRPISDDALRDLVTLSEPVERAARRELIRVLGDDLPTLRDAVNEVRGTFDEVSERFQRVVSPLVDLKVALTDDGPDGYEAAFRAAGGIAPTEESARSLKRGGEITRAVVDYYEAAMAGRDDNPPEILEKIADLDPFEWSKNIPSPLADKINTWRGRILSAQQTYEAAERTAERIVQTAAVGTRRLLASLNGWLSNIFGMNQRFADPPSSTSW